MIFVKYVKIVLGNFRTMLIFYKCIQLILKKYI